MSLIISNWTKANEGLMQGMWTLNPLLEQFQFTWLPVNLKNWLCVNASSANPQPHNYMTNLVDS